MKVGLLLFLLHCVSCVDDWWIWGEERSSFYRWRGGVYSLEYSLDLLKRKEQTTLNIYFATIPNWTILGEAVWPMVVLHRVELVWLDFELVLHLFWALICLVVGLLPLWLMSGICIIVFLVYFRYFLCNSDMSFCKRSNTKTCGKG